MQQKIIEYLLNNSKKFIISLEGKYLQTKIFVLTITSILIYLLIAKQILNPYLPNWLIGIFLLVLFLNWLQSLADSLDNIVKLIDNHYQQKTNKKNFFFLYNNASPRTKELIQTILENNKTFFPLINCDYFQVIELTSILKESNLNHKIDNNSIVISLNTLNTLKSYLN